jgi:hypothetical protein
MNVLVEGALKKVVLTHSLYSNRRNAYITNGNKGNKQGYGAIWYLHVCMYTASCNVCSVNVHYW